MSCGADWITHIVQTIEHGDQVVVFTWKCFGLRDAKVEANLETVLSSGRAGSLDGFVVIIEAKELRIWEGFRHQHGGRTCAAPNICDARAGLELCLDVIQG